MPMTIVSLDPGQTSGLVVAQISSDANINIIQATELPWGGRFSLRQFLFTAWPDVVVCEAFRLYAQAAKAQINNEFPSVRVIGLLEAYLNETVGLDRLHFQAAMCIQRVEVLEEHKSALRGMVHARDAYKHLRYYAITRLAGTTYEDP